MGNEENIRKVIAEVVDQYSLSLADFGITKVGTGHINHTFQLTGEKNFVLQRVNKSVFTRPEIISTNIRLAEQFLSKNQSDYLFVAPLPASNGDVMVYDQDGHPWRLYPYINNTYTIDQATTLEQARSAAKAFARLGNLLRGCDVSQFGATIDRFHDLAWRYEQLQEALGGASTERIKDAQGAIEIALSFEHLVNRYRKLISEDSLTPGVFHNDTKINNVLFDRVSGNTVAVIDLDTLMPGYFIYDLGDLVRTIVSPVSEEESDLSKIEVRLPFLNAVIDGYMSEIGPALSEREKSNAPFAGLMMTYIMALRFLADYLRGDTYYHIAYKEQNLVRASNQLKLLQLLEGQLK